ncbi:Lacal_2735 family protein [Tunicatimonas pelagia]|uniref:Lacal_2735 family protein n=1 Tax=Tunicatimonas pelagia TaxID=931531 RepID=UPI0026659FFA|nr:Lacal_2735 family protein [Tunicatimonas pelagia]WKN43633.1 Lacal_2735 family protein [Tunicatimonas pelagia]
MFGLFKKKDPLEKLQDKYRKLLAESHTLSQRDRRAGDEKMAEAEEVAKEIDRLKSEGA